MWNKPYCPCMKGEENYTQCTALIVKGMYIQLCSTNQYSNCQHFAKMYGGLKTPIEWLQIDAVEKYKMNEELEDEP